MRFSVVKPRIFNFFHELRKDKAANLPVGTAGFYWVCGIIKVLSKC